MTAAARPRRRRRPRLVALPGGREPEQLSRFAAWCDRAERALPTLNMHLGRELARLGADGQRDAVRLLEQMLATIEVAAPSRAVAEASLRMAATLLLATSHPAVERRGLRVVAAPPVRVDTPQPSAPPVTAA